MFQSNKQKKKDKLWFACQTRFQQYNQDIDVMPNVQQQRHHPQRPLHPQSSHHQIQSYLHQQQQQQPLLMMDPRETPPPQYGQAMRCCGKCSCSMSSMLESSEKTSNYNNNHQQLMYPPYPTNTPQCVCLNNCFGNVADEMSYSMDLESGSEEMSIELDCETKTGGCYCGNYGDNSIDCNDGDDYDRQYSNNWSMTTTTMGKATKPTITGELIAERLTNWQTNQNSAFHQQHPHHQQEHQHQHHQTSMATTTTNVNKSTGTTIAGNVLRNYCCTGGGCVSNESSIGSTCPNQTHPNQIYSPNPMAMLIPTTTTTPTVTSTLTATAASVFRNCCRGVGSQSNESSLGIYDNSHQNNNNRNFTYNMNIQNIQNNNNNSKNNYNSYEQKFTTDSSGPLRTKELFKALMKKLKDPQLDTLCQVVENRLNATTNNGTAAGGTIANTNIVGSSDSNNTSGGWRRQNRSSAAASSHQTSSTCVLVPRESIGGEEPFVIACRLWFWPDLRDSSELKRIPMCPNGKELVYVCCNPAHWNRILIPETAPPPYQPAIMDRLKPEDRAPSENLKDGGCSTVSSTTTGLRVQIPESFTTNGEDHSSPSSTWCQIAYWELAQRVGERYEAKNSTVNIYSEGSGGMCLKDLADKNDKKFKENRLSSVQKTRQKIGLGITLSQEADGVWLYNRSEAPIFVHSPTLNDDCRHVSKVPPGYCLNAFDINRARTQKLVCPPQIAGAQTGPIDTFSMQISFAKGWGSSYRRTDITACHCWLEVLFARR